MLTVHGGAPTRYEHYDRAAPTLNQHLVVRRRYRRRSRGFLSNGFWMRIRQEIRIELGLRRFGLELWAH